MQKILSQQRTFKWRCEVFIVKMWNFHRFKQVKEKKTTKNSAKNSTENRKYLYCSSKLSKQMIKKKEIYYYKNEI